MNWEVITKSQCALMVFALLLTASSHGVAVREDGGGAVSSSAGLNSSGVRAAGVSSSAGFYSTAASPATSTGGLNAWERTAVDQPGNPGPAVTLASYTPATLEQDVARAKAASLPLGRRHVDKVVVEKSSKKMYLLLGNEILREYPIALGKNPVGHKQEEGDGRTPEGRYTLDWRKANSKYYRSIHISYPNDQDVEQARARNKEPGEYIMIHGSPAWVPSPEWAKNWLNKENWTEGCIAVTNDVMDEVWALVKDGTPIEIRP